jgi:HPt (histidine-containing phosphotransfer) domain-containing protein
MDAIVGKPINIDELLEQMELHTPEGVGLAASEIKLETKSISTPLVDIDFSPLHTLADTAKGLSTWRDAHVYAQALLDFANQHSQDAKKISDMLADENKPLQMIERIAHALKGVAGNLALTDIAELTAGIDQQLKAGHRQGLEAELSALDGALTAIAAAINQLQLPESQSNEHQIQIDAEQVKSVLQQLLMALDGLNPDRVQPIIQQLASCLDQGKLKSIQHYVDNFDFDAAKCEANKLLEQLD